MERLSNIWTAKLDDNFLSVTGSVCSIRTKRVFRGRFGHLRYLVQREPGKSGSSCKEVHKDTLRSYTFNKFIRLELYTANCIDVIVKQLKNVNTGDRRIDTQIRCLKH